MTLYDSSVLIEYLDGNEDAVDYVENHIDERAVTTPLAVYEVYQGEVYKSGAADFEAVDGALSWVTVVDETRELARAAAELQNELADSGTPLSARDAFIAGVAWGLGERLVVADGDFEVEALRNRLDVDFL